MEKRASESRGSLLAALYKILGLALVAVLCLLFLLPVGNTRWVD